MAILDIEVINKNSEQLILSCGPDYAKENDINLIGVVRLYNLTKDETIITWNYSDRLLKIDFDRTNEILVCGSYDSSIVILPKFLEGVTDNPVLLKGHKNYITSVKFLPLNPSNIVSCSYDGTIKLWDINTMTCLNTLIPKEATNDDIHFHDISLHDGLLAAGSSGGLIMVWDIVSGEFVRQLEGHKDMVLSVAFSPNGKLYSGSKDTTVRVWDPLFNFKDLFLDFSIYTRNKKCPNRFLRDKGIY